MIPSVILYLFFSKGYKIVFFYSYVFFIGIATSIFYTKITNNIIIYNISSFIGFILIVLLFLNLPVLRKQLGLVYSNHSYLNIWLDPITWLVVYFLFIYAIADSKSLNFLKWKIFTFMGEISYGFYLLHYPILIYFKNSVINPIIGFCLTLIVTMTISYLSYKYFERPVRKKINDF